MKAPEVFAPGSRDEETKTFPDFHRKFITWLSAVEPRFGEHIDNIEKDTGTKAEDVASKGEEKVVALVVALEKDVENTTRKEVTGKVSAIIVKSLDIMKLNAG